MPVFVYFMVAAAAHGFYDFWLIHRFPVDMSWLTMLFFLVTVHFWFKMKNNAINISNFYSPKIHLVNGVMKRRLLLSVLVMLSIGVLFISMRHGVVQARSFFMREAFFYGYFAIYLIFSIDKFRVVKGYVEPLDLPFNALLPRAIDHHHLSGMHFEFNSLVPSKTRRHELLASLLPVSGSVVRRIVVKGDKREWFVLKMDEPKSQKR
jgi:hypothetical protein